MERIDLDDFNVCLTADEQSVFVPVGMYHALIRLARADVAMYQIDVDNWPGREYHAAAWHERDAAIKPFLPPMTGAKGEK